ncbi:MAG: succinate dehydrogenase iron-sulfur subunit [Planctomycetes bacterium]|nr:succinate dehydrogenase iron-sulfur subunit [Planctomycetota bacterium]
MGKTVTIAVQRRDRPDASDRWEEFEIPRESGLNITGCLQRIAAHPVTVEGTKTTPVSYDACCLEEVCGACTMVINGRVRQACSALVDELTEHSSGKITLEPMSKFPVVRDLVVNRQRMFDSLTRVRAWVPVDGYFDRGPGPQESQEAQEADYPLSRCMSCGCCLEACPQFTLTNDFLGAAAISQAVLFNSHPVATFESGKRNEALVAPGGIADCGNAQMCVKVCPKDIPLTDSIARAGRMATVHTIKNWLGR